MDCGLVVQLQEQTAKALNHKTHEFNLWLSAFASLLLQLDNQPAIFFIVCYLGDRHTLASFPGLSQFFNVDAAVHSLVKYSCIANPVTITYSGKTSLRAEIVLFVHFLHTFTRVATV